jgi:hypothetical protein
VALDPNVQGAFIALTGVGLTLLVTAVNEYRRELRADRREAERHRQASSDRIFEHRRDAYVAFAELLYQWRSSLLNREILEGDLPDTDFDTFDPVFESLASVQLYGSIRGYQSGLTAAGSMIDWLNSTKASRAERLEAFDEAREDFVQQIRLDLGVAEGVP